MKNTVKKIFTSVFISLATLIAGLIITMVSFRLFGNLSTNEMRLLFAVDIISLVSAGAGFLIFQENKSCKRKKEEAYRSRRNEHIAQLGREMNETERIINHSNFAA